MQQLAATQLLTMLLVHKVELGGRGRELLVALQLLGELSLRGGQDFFGAFARQRPAHHDILLEGVLGALSRASADGSMSVNVLPNLPLLGTLEGQTLSTVFQASFVLLGLQVGRATAAATEKQQNQESRWYLHARHFSRGRLLANQLLTARGVVAIIRELFFGGLSHVSHL